MNSDDKKPLFLLPGTEAAPGFPALLGGRCSCGHVFFPMQWFGCEKCGRHDSDLSQIKLSGRGMLRAYAQVHLHARPSPRVPFTVLEIELDDGPIIRALFDQPTAAGLRKGEPMVSTIAQYGEVEVLRFRRADAAE